MVCRSGSGQNYKGDDKTNPPHFRNWAENIGFSPKELRAPDNLPSLVEAVAQAGEQEKSIHAFGSKWSYTDCAAADDVMVSLNGTVAASPAITYIVDNVDLIRNEWRWPFLAPTHKLVHYPAGIVLGDLIKDLNQQKLTLPTLGGSDGQTLGGAISTSVHGGDWKQPPICDIVRAVHLVGAGGQEFWIESGSAPLTISDRNNEKLLNKLPCQTTIVIRDDNVFNAVRVACGRFGVIYSVVLEVVDAFQVVQWVTQPNRNRVLQALRQGIGTPSLFTPVLSLLNEIPRSPDFSDADTVPYFFSITFNSTRPDDVWAIRRWPTPGAKPDDKIDPNADKNNFIRPAASLILEAVRNLILGAAAVEPSVLALLGPVGLLIEAGWTAQVALVATELLTTLTVLLGEVAAGVARLGDVAAAAVNGLWQMPGGENVIPDVTKLLFAANMGGKYHLKGRGPFADVTAGTPSDEYRADSIEVIFDAATGSYLNFLDEVFAAAPAFHQAGYISMRTCMPSTALLSMHNVASMQRAVSIELASLSGLDGNAAWFPYVESRALAYQGRPHWGQLNSLKANTVAMSYPMLNAWREALFRVNGSSTNFSNAFSQQRGLEPMGIIRRVKCTVSNDGMITHLGSTGEYWSPVPIEPALEQITQGRVIYLAESSVSIMPVLTVTNKDGTTGLNPASDAFLKQLPACPIVVVPTDTSQPWVSLLLQTEITNQPWVSLLLT